MVVNSPYITIRGRAKIWGILFAHYNPDFRVVLGRCPHVPDFWYVFNHLHTQIPEKVYFQDYLSNYHLLTFHIGQFCVDERCVCTDFWPNN